MKLLSTLVTAFFCIVVHGGFGYALEGPRWTLNRTLYLNCSFDAVKQPTGVNRSFDREVSAAVVQWGFYPIYHFQAVERLSIDGLRVPTPAPGDDEISASFSNTIFGDTFGRDVLAVAVYVSHGSVMAEGDILLNLARNWDIPDGIPQTPLDPFDQTIQHEFGHVLGLDHPDEHGQKVDALMNSYYIDGQQLTSDDYAGVQALYGEGPEHLNAVNAPVLKNLSTRGLVGTGDNVLIAGFIVQGSGPATLILRAIGQSLTISGVTNPLFDPKLTVYDSSGGVVAENDDWIDGPDAETIASFQFDPENSLASAVYITLDPGAYTVVMEGVADDNHPATGIGLVELYDVHTTAGRAGNISTRGQVMNGDDVIIGGFIVGGESGRNVIVRALGSSLSNHGVANALADPVLELHDTYGTLISVNDNWADGPDADTISAAGLALSDPKEAALLITVYPSQITTAIVKSANADVGIGLVEVYDFDPAEK